MLSDVVPVLCIPIPKMRVGMASKLIGRTKLPCGSLKGQKWAPSCIGHCFHSTSSRWSSLPGSRSPWGHVFWKPFGTTPRFFGSIFGHTSRQVHYHWGRPVSPRSTGASSRCEHPGWPWIAHEAPHAGASRRWRRVPANRARGHVLGANPGPQPPLTISRSPASLRRRRTPAQPPDGQELA
jgi:hypothetical protein